MIKEVLKFSSGYRLKNIKSMSGREGIAWSATLYKEGKALGKVLDEGNGGAVDVNIATADLTALQAIARVMIKADFEPEGLFLSALADYTDLITNLKRQNTKHIVVIHDDKCDEYGIPNSISKFKCPNNPTNLAMIRQRFPEKRLLADEIALW